MRTWIDCRIAIACLLTIAVSASPAAGPATTRARRPFLGAYMHLDPILGKAPDAATRRAVLAKTLDRFQAAGLRVAMPYVKDTDGGALYDSQVVPLRRYHDWDALAAFMAEARARKLEVWPVICVVPSGLDAPNGILLTHPEWALRDKNGKPIGYLSPCNPKAREWMVAMISEVVTRYHPDGILLDYLRFPSQRIQLDPESAAEFNKRYSAPPPSQAGARGGPASAPDAQNQQRFQSFKEHALTELARMIRQELRRVAPGVRIGIYTWGPQVTTNHSVAQDWRTWVAKGYIDMVNVSGYCYPDNFGPEYLTVFEKRMKDAVGIVRESGGSADLSFALGVSTSHGRVHSARQIGDYLRIARAAGIDGVAFFTWSTLQPYLDEVLAGGYLK